ncbi:hypothetical protein JCM10049v2_002003 [Rhodotorula toruloides]
MRSPLLLASLLSLSITIAARTVTFDDGDSHLAYAPDGAWSVVEGVDFSAGSARRTTARGGQVTMAFAGQQISLYGSTTASFAVFVDGKTTPTSSSPPSSSFSNATSSRFFLLKGLAAEQAHNLTLVVTGDGSLVLDRIAVAVSNGVSTTPALLPVGTIGILSTATVTSSSSTSSLAASSTLRAVDPQLRGTSRAGLIAGSVIGSLGAFAILIFLTCLFLRRRRQRHSTSHSPDLGARLRTAQAEHARRKSTQSLFASAFNRSRSSPLPFATPPPPTDNGGISSFPRPALSHPFAAPARPSPPTSNQGSWPSFSFLTRASSWRLRADRLPETRRFYNLGKAGLPVTKPPEGPLPAVPGPARVVREGEVREMEERWRTDGPSVVLPGAVVGSGRGTPLRGGRGQKEVRWDERETERRDVRQVWGEAMSDYDAGSETSSGRVRVQSPAATHGRRRSFPPEPDDLPLPPLQQPPPHHHPSHSHSTTHTFHNPFNSTSSSHSHSYHASHPSHGSSASSHVEGTTTIDWHPSAAHIHTAHSVSLPSQARPHLPVRTSSKREVHETVRAGPEGEGVVRTGSMLERRPTLTEAPVGSPARAAGGASGRAERRRHQSHAGLIEVVADVAHEQERDEHDGRRRYQRRRTGSNGVADPLPGEEDRPGFFQQRETLPRYDARRGDPRLLPR